MLYESFWSSVARDWRTPFFAVKALTKGRANLKRHLTHASNVDAATLPYDKVVVEYIEAWRSSGGRTALVTASDFKFAQAISEHLGIFDEVHGSDGQTNLKGEKKGQFLERQFGNNGFVYMGDAMSDLAIWKRSAKAITVNAHYALRRKAERVSSEAEHIATRENVLEPYLKEIRPHQWLKNVLVFLPALAAHQFDFLTLTLSILAFLCFSLVASSVYVLNDLVDLASDRAHPRKKYRPLASGSIPIAHGAWMTGGFLLVGAILGFIIGWQFLIVIAGYYLLNIAYSFDLKRRVVIDICVLAGLYTIRIIAGGAAAGIPLSIWLLAFSVFIFLSLAAVKRQAELIDSAERGKLSATGRGYHVSDLPIISMISIAAGYVSVLVLVLYVESTDVAKLYTYPEALWGVCAILLYWITRTVMVSSRGGMHDDPVVYAVKDRVSQLCGLLVAAFLLLGTLL